MHCRFPESYRLKTILVVVILLLSVACAGKQAANGEQPIEPTFQEKVSECSRIADRSERNRCLYGDG